MSGRRAQTLAPPLTDDKPQRGKCLTGLCFLWKILTCLVSHATLVLLVVCYCVGGAYLFQHLEKPHEIEVKKGIQNIRYNLTDKIWKFSDNTSVLSESDWIDNVEKDLMSFEKQILTAMRSNGWDGDEDITKTQWTFAGSLFYSIIVITTIGYGHISPHTDWGKVTTIFYAIMGIPLMLLCLSNIGDVMATSFRFIYWRVCCYACTRKSRPRRRNRPPPAQRQRSQLASLRRGNKRAAHTLDRGAGAGLQHAHSDPELRHVNPRAFEQDAYDGQWECPHHGHEYTSSARRHNNRARWEHEVPPLGGGRHSTRSERWSRAMPPPPPPATGDAYVRYTQSLPRGRAASRRMRARTIDPHYDDTELLRKIPIISNRYALQDDYEQDNAAVGGKNKLRSQSMPRGQHLDIDGQRSSRRSRAMSVMPRVPPYVHHRGQHIELSEMRASHYRQPMATPSPECMSCLTEHAYHHHAHHPHYPRKAMMRQSRAEKLPPSPRIMSPMGFAVKRQTRQPSSFDYDNDSAYGGANDYYGEMTDKNRPVPIWLCVFLVISYILGGAVLFAYWEQWSFLDSAYFCFITLTTIGFGDFVPAKGVKDESEQSIAYCSLYLLFGIALLAMSFNLVQEEFIANVKEVARRLGIIKEDEDDDE